MKSQPYHVAGTCTECATSLELVAKDGFRYSPDSASYDLYTCPNEECGENGVAIPDCPPETSAAWESVTFPYRRVFPIQTCDYIWIKELFVAKGN